VSLHRRFVAAFPGVDVPAEYLKADSWLAANPTKRKTPRGMPKFLNGWMERAQNRGGAPNGSRDVSRGWSPPAPASAFTPGTVDMRAIMRKADGK
jgi:hypothetical protein